MKIDQKSIVIGFVVGLIILVVAYFGYAVPIVGVYLSPVIAGVIVGYLANQSTKIGAMHGTVVGAFCGVAAVAILYIIITGKPQLLGLLLILAPWYLGTFILLGLLGGAIGSLIKSRSSPVVE